MPKTKKRFVFCEARFSLTPEEHLEFQKMLNESNRTADNLVETVLKMIIDRRKQGGLFLDFTEIGIRYKPKTIPVTKKSTSHE